MSAPDRIWAKPLSEEYYPTGKWEDNSSFGGTEYIRADLVPQWMPVDTYDGKDFFVLISDGNYWTLGVKRKYWHDTSEGDWTVTSPMHDQPKYWMPSTSLNPLPAT